MEEIITQYVKETDGRRGVQLESLYWIQKPAVGCFCHYYTARCNKVQNLLTGSSVYRMEFVALNAGAGGQIFFIQAFPPEVGAANICTVKRLGNTK